ncbi:MAG: dihydroorotate dehydrogenase electron transfer subunit [Lachnospiraceae bacterium]|nr:dihydroorotate dehydrogenase electron transfer subunit [Lachnospiraceae bacterium]
MKKKTIGVVISQKMIAPAIYDLWIKTDLARDAKPGQFVGVFPKDKSTLLPRPISICEVNEDKTALRLVYRIAGQGTAEFSKWNAGEEVALLGVLGNGFPLEKAQGKRVFLMGGGIGIPPMLELAKALSPGAAKGLDAGTDESAASKEGAAKVCSIMGYRDAQTFLRPDLEQYGEVVIATEDGSVGTKGNVMDAIRENALTADVIFACGPMPMLRAIKAYAAEQGIPAYISLEEHMACGVGACLGCVVKTKEVDHHSHVNNARICTDGPVFEAGEVEI